MLGKGPTTSLRRLDSKRRPVARNERGPQFTGLPPESPAGDGTCTRLDLPDLLSAEDEACDATKRKTVFGYPERPALHSTRLACLATVRYYSKPKFPNGMPYTDASGESLSDPTSGKSELQQTCGTTRRKQISTAAKHNESPAASHLLPLPAASHLLPMPTSS